MKALERVIGKFHRDFFHTYYYQLDSHNDIVRHWLVFNIFWAICILSVFVFFKHMRNWRKEKRFGNIDLKAFYPTGLNKRRSICTKTATMSKLTLGYLLSSDRISAQPKLNLVIFFSYQCYCYCNFYLYICPF